MLSILGWTVATLLALFIAGVYVWARFAPRDPMGLSAVRKRVMAQQHHVMMGVIDEGERDRRLHAIRRDMRYADHLMALEQEVHGLRTRYAHRSKDGPKYSDSVQDAIDRLNVEIAALKEEHRS